MDQHDSAVFARWAEIETELDAVQKHIKVQQNSWRRRVAEWGGALALIISIAVGAFTVIDRAVLAVVGPDERREADLARLSDIVVEITKTNLATMSDFQQGRVSEAASVQRAQTANSIKLLRLASAVEIIDSHPDYVDSLTLMVVVMENVYAQDYIRAERYADMARDRAHTPDIAVEATLMLAMAKMGRVDPASQEQARRLFLEAIEAAKTIKTVNGPWLISNALRDWAIAEAVLANCAQSAEVFERFFLDIPDPIGRAARFTGTSAVMQSVSMNGTCRPDAYQQLFANHQAG